MQPAIASMGFSYYTGLMDLTTVSPKYQVVSSYSLKGTNTG